MLIRPARPDECDALTMIAMRAKAFWGYPPAWLEAWKPDLTFTPELLASTMTLVAESEDTVVGVSCLDSNQSPPELVHLWIDPSSIGGGIGSVLFQQTCLHARHAGHQRLALDSDPNAADFYRRMGCVPVGMTSAPVLGIARKLPRFEMVLVPDSWE